MKNNGSYILFRFLFIGLCLYFLNSCKKKIQTEIDPYVLIEKKVDSLLSLMTLEEKIGQM